MPSKIKRTYGDMLSVLNTIGAIKVEKSTKAHSKMSKVANKLKPFYEEYNEKREEIRLDNAYVNKDGVLEFNEKGDYKFTKDGIKKMTKQLKELLDEEFEFYPLSFSSEGIEGFNFLSGWVESMTQEKSEEEVED
jgi:hypothetical protein